MADHNILGMVKNRLRENLHQLNHKISEEDATRLARYLLEDLETARWRVVPATPTREMINASTTAMRKRRRNEGWVAEKQKHAWRLAAGIEAAPHWDSAKETFGGPIDVERDAPAATLSIEHPSAARQS